MSRGLSRIRWPRLGLPLLTKELIEQSARKRTYVLRVVYALLLFGAAFVFFYEILDRSSQSVFSVLGRGREMFEALVGLQFAGIYLFLPAMTCTALTVEKERDSLQLLFLTRLGPWAILFEKLLSRLVPMLSFLLLSLPLLAFAYSLGGVSEDYLWGGVWCLVITIVQVGTLSLMCSAFFRTTVGAFIASYLLGFALFFTLPFLTEMLFTRDWVNDVAMTLLPLTQLVGVLFNPAEYLVLMFFGPYLFLEIARQATFGPLIACSVPLLTSAAMCLVLARVFVVRRAFAPPKNLLLGLFRRLDGIFSRLNDRLARGVVLSRDSVALPDDEPVAWRETSKKSLGTVRYLFRVFVALEVPTAILCLFVAVDGTRSGQELAAVLLFGLWILAVLIVAATASSLVAGERSRQTLDVLLTTPLHGEAIIRQKMRGVRRLMIVVAIPILTVVLLETLVRAGLSGGGYEYGSRSGFEFSGFAYLTCSVLQVLVYLPLTAWLSFLVGLRVRSQTRAIMGSLAILVTWCIGPIMLFVTYIQLAHVSGRSSLVWLTLSSPLIIIPFNEFFEYRDFNSVWGPIVLNFVIYGTCLSGLRWVSLNNADKYLGRNSESMSDSATAEHSAASAPTP